MQKITFSLMMAAVIFMCACTSTKNGTMKPLETVPSVNIEKYMDTWYEIARYPNKFQDDSCVAAQAQYSLRSDGKVEVLNSCREGSVDGKVNSIEGKAWSVDKQTNAKLKVQFFWPFSGDYWVIQLDKDYKYAVVGHPERTLLWVLSRTPVLDENTFNAIKQKLREQGYDPARMIMLPQKKG